MFGIGLIFVTVERWVPKWGDTPVQDLQPRSLELWLRELPLSHQRGACTPMVGCGLAIVPSVMANQLDASLKETGRGLLSVYCIMQDKARLLTKSDYTHPMKGDVKEKILSPPLAWNQSVVTYIQPCLHLWGAFDVAALDQRRCPLQLIIPTWWFHATVALDASRLRSYASQAVGLNANHHPIWGSRPMAFCGYPRGHRIDPETRCCMAAHGA